MQVGRKAGHELHESRVDGLEGIAVPPGQDASLRWGQEKLKRRINQTNIHNGTIENKNHIKRRNEEKQTGNIRRQKQNNTEFDEQE